jgi:uncharacterized protein (DUF488 family)
MVPEILTFGYEGLSVANFVDRLKLAQVEIVVDVRANPLSRKPGLSKKMLALHLEASGIEYVHAAKMGCPKSVRDRYKADNDWATYTHGFLSYIACQGEAVAEVSAIARRSRACLICFEADFNFCHRTYVARAAAPLIGARISHLTAETSIEDHGARRAA